MGSPELLLKLCIVYEVDAGCCSKHIEDSLLAASPRDPPAGFVMGPKAVCGLLGATLVLSFRTLALGTRVRREGGRDKEGVAVDGAVSLMPCLQGSLIMAMKLPASQTLRGMADYHTKSINFRNRRPGFTPQSFHLLTKLP